MTWPPPWVLRRFVGCTETLRATPRDESTPTLVQPCVPGAWVVGGQQTPGSARAVVRSKLTATLAGLSILSLQKASASSWSHSFGPPQFPQLPLQYHWLMREKS